MEARLKEQEECSTLTHCNKVTHQNDKFLRCDLELGHSGRHYDETEKRFWDFQWSKVGFARAKGNRILEVP